MRKRQQATEGPIFPSQNRVENSNFSGEQPLNPEFSLSASGSRRMSLFITNKRIGERRMSDSLFQLDPRMEEATVIGPEHLSQISLRFWDPELEKDYFKFLQKEMPVEHWIQFTFKYMITGIFAFIPVITFNRIFYPQGGLASNYGLSIDSGLLLGAWVFPLLLNIGVFKVLHEREWTRYCSHFAVIFNWIASGMGILGHWHFVDKSNVPTGPFAFFLPALFSFHIFNFIPFKMSLVSVTVLCFFYFLLAWTKQYYLMESFVHVIVSMVVTCSVVVYICYQQERSNREQFFNARKLNRANLKLVNQLKSLQLSFGRKAMDFDSPLEKATALVRSLLADSSISSNQMEILNIIVNLLYTRNLYAPDLDNQVKGGQLKMDLQQEKWLFSEVVKRNPTLLNSRKRKSITNLTMMTDRNHGRRLSAPPSMKIDSTASLESQLNVIYELIGTCSLSRGGPSNGTMGLGTRDSFRLKLSPVLSEINDLNFPIFKFQELTGNHPLLVGSLYIFQSYDLFTNLNIDSSKFCRFIMSIESGYRRDIPYHTSTHATDVLHAMYYFCSQTNVKDIVTDFDLLCLFTAAIVHDFDHPGVNNNFLAAVLDPKAILYNDRSILENHHLARSFEILIKPDHNFTENLTLQEFKDFRTSVIESVLATDLAKHFEILSMFKSKMMGSDSKFSPDINKEDHTMLFNIMMKCADVCNSSKTLPLHKKWVNLVLEEFFIQGDREKALKLCVSPLMDRDTVDIASSQTGFIDFICAPLYEAFHKYADIYQVIEGIERNRLYWATSNPRDKNGDDKKDDEEEYHVNDDNK